MDYPRITKENLFSALEDQDRPWQKNYLVMYSTQWPGVTTDPDLMTVPFDDHLVHRGDGVFDVMRCVRGGIYQMEEHLRRFEKSAKAVSLNFPTVYRRIRELIKDMVSLGGEKNCLIRLVLSRGPGSYSPNPNDCPSSHLHVNVNRFHDPPKKWYAEGVPIMTSSIPTKRGFFATIKSCDYLPNVLMKMEAVKAGYDFAVALDEEGFLAEGAIENIGVLTSDNILKFPKHERTLSGVTMSRVFDLAADVADGSIIRDVRFDQIALKEAYGAREVFLTGTSINILPVVLYDGRTIGDGSPGPVFKRLYDLLWEDMTRNSAVQTKVKF